MRPHDLLPVVAVALSFLLAEDSNILIVVCIYTIVLCCGIICGADVRRSCVGTWHTIDIM